MKLSKYQEDLLKNITSVEKRNWVRNQMKEILKSIKRNETLLSELSYHKSYPGWTPGEFIYWEKEIDRKRKELLSFEERLKEENHA